MASAPSQGLTRAAFEALLRLLDPVRERAGALYEGIRSRLIRLFEWRGAADAVDLADEVINRVARRVDEGVEVRAKDPYVYFSGVAQVVLLEVARRAARQPPALEAGEQLCVAIGNDDHGERQTCVERCLAALPPDQRRVLLEYYQGGHNVRLRQQLSRDLGISTTALRLRVHRIRCRVRDCVEECLRKSSKS